MHLLKSIEPNMSKQFGGRLARRGLKIRICCDELVDAVNRFSGCVVYRDAKGAFGFFEAISRALELFSVVLKLPDGKEQANPDSECLQSIDR